MFPRKKTLKRAIELDGIAIPVSIRLELVEGHAYRISSKSLRLRLPIWAGEDLINHHLQACKVWVEQVFTQKPALREAFMGNETVHGDTLQVGERRYHLHVVEKEKATNTARLIGDTISLEINPQLNAWQRSRVIKTLLSRIIARDFLPDITRRVLEWNEMTFRRPIKNVYLKYNHSNWGSCSRDGNVNLSTRLLFAPPEVQDYVILHELAHLVELNHSDRFWALVSQYMPDYPNKEKWLKKNGSKCDF